VALLPLLILLPLTMLSSMASATRRLPAALSGETFAVLRKVPTGPSNETSDPPPPPSQMAESPIVDFLELRKVLTGPSNETSDPLPPPSQVTESPVIDFPVLRKVPTGHSNIQAIHRRHRRSPRAQSCWGDFDACTVIIVH